MKLILIALLLPLVCGCTSHHKADFSRAIAAEGFEWDGNIQVRCVRGGLFRTPAIDRIELGSKDGRSVVLLHRDGDVRAFIEVKVSDVPPPARPRKTEDLRALESD